MELNTKGRYAVMAMADLARHHISRVGQEAAVDAVPLSEIAERQQISLAYLEQLFQRLRRAGLVESMRGRTGGYALAVAPAAVSIAAILKAVEEPVQMTRCGGEGGCIGHERCITHDLWDALGEHIAGFFQGVSLQDVIDGMPQRRSTVKTSPAATLRRAAAE